MPLDTRITIRIEALGDRDSTGEYQPGPTTSFPAWADEMKSSEDDHLETGGARTISVRHFRVRHFQALAVANVALVSLVDSLGLVWNVDSVEPSDDRRRFILIRGVREITAADSGGGGGGDTNGDGMTPSNTYALAATEQSGIRRFARTQNMVNVADFYDGGFPKRMIATFTGGEVINSATNGPRCTFSLDESLDDAEVNNSGGPLTTGFDGRTFHAPTTQPSDFQTGFFIVYWIDRSSDGSPEPDSIDSFAFI